VASFPLSVQQTVAIGNATQLEEIGLAPTLFTFSLSLKM
jgi:hypothetical protein